MKRRTAMLLALLATALLAAGCGDTPSSVGGAGADETEAATPRRPDDAPLLVSAAASLKAAFTAYGKDFRDAKARFSFAGSDVLEGQIRQGLRPDVFAAANVSIPGRLAVAELVEAPVMFASNELVLAMPAGGDNRISSLDDITRKGVRLAIGTPSVPVGSYTRTVLENLTPSKREAIVANVRSEEPDVTGIVGKLTQGAVDAAFVYETDARATNGRVRYIRLDPRLRPTVTYAVAVVKGARNPQAAKLFIYGLLAGAGRKELLAAGFGPPQL